jgi:hypothetical protein
MKKLLLLFVAFLPMVLQAQRNPGNAASPDYMWLNAGNAGFTPGSAEFPSLAFSPAGVPYVAYYDVSDIFYMTVSVKKLEGGSWVNAGPANFDTAGPSQLAFSPAGVPYIAYSDYYL